MSEKMWTYAEITASTQRQLNRYADQAAKETDEYTIRLLKGMALGVQMHWEMLTFGSQDEGDIAQIAVLVSRING
jgi:N-acetylglucosamine kinase-like BadF-type ATPase